MRALFARYPALAGHPRLATADLGVVTTPIERWRVAGRALLVKRDDLSASTVGGNKVRALEFLLGAVPAGRTLLTVGATGSTHALAVATHGARLGLHTEVITWPQEDHDVSRATSAALARVARVTAAGSVAEAFVRATVRRLQGGRHWIPAGGSVPLGILGHVSAALELAAQVDERSASPPACVVVPLGSGGTAAGLLVGFAIARLPVRVIGVQVVPRLVARQARVARLARRTHALIARLAGEPLPPLDLRDFMVYRDVYGGAYGRDTAEARAAAAALRACGGPTVDATYSAKTLAAALRLARDRADDTVLFWLTFDGRWLPDLAT